ncbi:MAG: chemotaxis protein CheE [Caulobacteraceae bacterium]|nr:chemotaxis protein CheE [Caulobacteraceae bacterium]
MTNAARVYKIENRLAKSIQLPGGRTVADALRSADERVGRMKAVCMTAVGAKIAAMSGFSARGQAGQAPEAMTEIYGLADEIIALTGAVGLADLANAAHCLCDLTDRFRHSASPAWPAINIHIDGLRLLSVENRPLAERQAILEGLHQLASHILPVGEA